VKRDDPYLFGRVGPFAVLLPAQLVNHVRITDDRSEIADQPDLIDLRRLFKTDELLQPTLVKLHCEAGEECGILLDRVGQIHLIAASEFLSLPASFSYAKMLFDAVCSRPTEGLHALRLRSDPSFMPMPDPTHFRCT
jgi:hypothetical protein